MAAIESFARRHVGLTYYALVFVISWGGLLLVVGPGGIPGRPGRIATMMPIALVALFAGPSLAGDACNTLVHGRAGLRDLVTRGLRLRVGLRAYAAAVIPAPLLWATVGAIALAGRTHLLRHSWRPPLREATP